MDNIEEMDRFLEKLNFPRLNQEELEIMDKPIFTEIETVIKKNLPNTKAQVSKLLSIFKIKFKRTEHLHISRVHQRFY